MATVYAELRRSVRAVKRVMNKINARVRELEAENAPMGVVHSELGRIACFNEALDELTCMANEAERKLLAACVKQDRRRRVVTPNQSKAEQVA